jgi:methionyl aminopeptidase
MIVIKDKKAQETMKIAGKLLSEVFHELAYEVKAGVSTLDLENSIARLLMERSLVSQSLGYHGYKYVSCISINDEVVHGLPSAQRMVCSGDLVKVDVCAAYKGYCADATRCFFVDECPGTEAQLLVDVAQKSLDAGIAAAVVGGRLGDICSAIQTVVERNGFSVVRNFAGHGIGKRMHEDPEILNFGVAGTGPLLKSGMAFALEPMINVGSYEVYVAADGWTAKTADGSLSAHVEDTVLITENGPYITTRMN